MTKDYHIVYGKTFVGLSDILHTSIRSGSHDYSSIADSQEHCVECYSDSDWAGCKVSRKSTSSGNMFLDGQRSIRFSLGNGSGRIFKSERGTVAFVLGFVGSARRNCTQRRRKNQAHSNQDIVVAGFTQTRKTHSAPSW